MNEFENNDKLENNNGFEDNSSIENINYENNNENLKDDFSSQNSGYKVYNSQGANVQSVSDYESLNENAYINLSNEKGHYENLNTTSGFERKNENCNEGFYANQREFNKAQSSIQIVTMNDKKKKSKKIARRAVAACATIAIFGCSVGFGIALGTKTSENIISENAEYGEFKFQDIPEVSQMSISDNNEIIGIVKNVSNSVVNISIKTKQKDFFNQIYENTGSGSGIIYKEDNEKIYIVTNNHVIDGATSVNISITGTEQIPAKLVGKDAQSDVAVISVQKEDLKSANIGNVKVAEFADSEQVEVGEYVLAIGNALGQGKTVTQGIISAQNKQVNIDGKRLNVLQTDAAINPGNSGGALVNSTGKIIGMNTAKLSGSTVEGTGYALPSSSVKSIADELIVNGTVSKPYLGIVGFTMSDDFIAMYDLNTKGIFIKGVEENSAAKAAGLKYSDIITSINGTKVSTMEELSAEISKCKVGDTIKIDIIRNGYEPMSVNATLADMNSKF